MPGRRVGGVACQWLGEREAFKAFATHTGPTQAAGHIKPLHWYVACRLVVEGGFRPEWIKPRPPFRIEEAGSGRRRRFLLHHEPELATGSEQTVLGGLKTKDVDVVVSISEIGPVLAISCKGVTRAFRNLTNRMEETIGECTNLHITYPALVLGYFSVLRANRTGQQAATAPELDAAEDAAAATPESMSEDGEIGQDEVALARNDLAFDENGNVVESVIRFHDALAAMSGRHGIRNDISRYEAITAVLVEPDGERAGQAIESYPPQDSRLHLSGFFRTLYQRYHERFILGAPLLTGQTNRCSWDSESPAFRGARSMDLGYAPRLTPSGV